MALFGSNKNVTEIIIQGNNQGARKAIAQTLNDLDRADREIGKMGRGFGNVLGGLGEFVTNPLTMMGGAAIAAAGGLAVLTKNTMEHGVQLQKMSTATGMSIEQLSALEKVSERTGVSHDELVKSYKNGNTALDAMVVKLIASGEVMSTDFVNGVMNTKTELDKLKTTFEDIGEGIAKVVNHDLMWFEFMYKKVGSLISGENSDELESFAVYQLHQRAKIRLEQEEAAEIVKTIEKQKEKQTVQKQTWMSRIEQQKRAKWGTRETDEFGLMAQPDNNLAIETLNGFQMRYVEMMDTRKALILEVSALEEANLAMLDGTASTAFGNMANAAMMFYEMSGQKSKEWFAIQKGFSIAQAIINTYEGATKALAQGGIFGPILAASVIAFGLAQVAAIASQQPGQGYSGGGGGAPSASSISTPREPRGGSSFNTTINVYGTLSDDDYARKMLPALQKAYRDGAGRREGWTR